MNEGSTVIFCDYCDDVDDDIVQKKHDTSAAVINILHRSGTTSTCNFCMRQILLHCNLFLVCVKFNELSHMTVLCMWSLWDSDLSLANHNQLLHVTVYCIVYFSHFMYALFI